MRPRCAISISSHMDANSRAQGCKKIRNRYIYVHRTHAKSMYSNWSRGFTINGNYLQCYEVSGTAEGRVSGLGGFDSEMQNEGSRFRCYGLWPRLSQSAGPWAKVSVGQRARERGPAVIGGRVMLPARQGLAIFAGQRALESARGCSHAAGMADFAMRR